MQKFLKKSSKILALSSVVFLTACSFKSGEWGFPYIAPTQQGNWLTEEQVSYLRKGMTQAQVNYALGTPTLIDALRPNVWQYPFYFKPGYGKSITRNFVVVFDENNQLIAWGGDPLPDYQPYQRNDISRPSVERAREVGASLGGRTDGDPIPTVQASEENQ